VLFRSLHDPQLMPDMAAAIDAITDAINRGARMRVFGDYDTDGITATALLVRALGALGGNVDWYLPHRIDDGYGLNIEALEQARADGVELGITVENGITAHAQIPHARQIGLPMIITDHHEPEGELPPALAVLNPKRADNQYPYRELAGVGVAFTLLRGLCAARGLRPDVPMRFLDLVTLGTLTGRHAPVCNAFANFVSVNVMLRRSAAAPSRSGCLHVDRGFRQRCRSARAVRPPAPG